MVTQDIRAARLSLIQGAQNVQIYGGNLSTVGRDMHHHTHTHYHGAAASLALTSFLKLVPNFRQIQVATLGRATPGTGLWICEWETFLLWLDPDGFLKILWGFGMPGAGKTILASIVISALEARAKALVSPICICYLYFRYSDHSAAPVQIFLEALVRQITERHPSCLAIVDDVYTSHIREETRPSEEELISLLRKCAEMFAANFYILDAVDEAPTKIQFDLVKKLASLNVKLFITSRPMEAVEARFPDAHCFSIAAQDRDIDLHIANEISRSPELYDLLEQADAAWQDKLVSSIKQKCGGMFLHASLQLDALQECTSLHDVRETLEEFPTQIEDIYIRTWKRILDLSTKKALLAKTVLLWVLTASRSMTVEELRRAVATAPDTYKFDPNRLVPEATLMGLCRGLVIVEEESRVVRLVHYTAQGTLHRLVLEAFPHPHSHLTAVCLTHLAKCGFQSTALRSEEALRAALDADPLLAYAYESWSTHACKSLSEQAPGVTRQLSPFVAGCHAFPIIFTPGEHHWREQFDLLEPLHVAAYFNFPITFAGSDYSQNLNHPTQNLGATPLILACSRNSRAVTEELLRLPCIRVNRDDDSGWTPLIWAIRMGHEDIVKLLVAHPEIDINLFDYERWTPLMHASSAARDGIVALLLNHPRIQVNSTDGHGRTALVAASQYGRGTGVVKLILAHPQVDVNRADEHGWTALIWASSAGYADKVELLLAHPSVEVNSANMGGWTALMWASQYGYSGTVKLLLAHPKIDHETDTKTTAELLLGHPDIDVNLADKGGMSALDTALFNGREGVVEVLLADPQIDLNRVQEPLGWSALMSHSMRGRANMVKLLLAHPEIDVNVVDPLGKTALSQDRGGELYVNVNAEQRT